jgi:hypothetical protein
MKKKIIALSLSLILLSGCGTTKPASDGCCEAKTETVSGEKDPIMKLLLSGLIILSVNFLFTK